MDPRNRNLNSAYTPKWSTTGLDLPTVNPGASGDTNFDPFMGSGWDRWLDAAGASEPGGVKMRGGDLPASPVPAGQQRLEGALQGINGTGVSGKQYIGNPRKPGRSALDTHMQSLYPGVV